MQDLPVIVQQYQALSQDALTPDDIRDFIKDIEELLATTDQELNRQQENNRTTGGDDIVAEEYDEGYDDIVFYLKPIADEVKGFDFKKERLRKIEEGESHLMDYLLRFKDKLSGD